MALQSPGNQLRLLELILNFICLESGRPDVHPGFVVAGPLDPQGCVAAGGLAVFLGHQVPGDIDGNEPIDSVLFVLLADLVGGQTRCDRQFRPSRVQTAAT